MNMSEEIPYQDIVSLALQEDIGNGDITTEAIYSGKEHSEAELIAKDNGIIAGLELADYIYKKLDPNIKFEQQVNDGNRVDKGQLIGTAKGPANLLLSAERTILNFMQRMSGVATMTRLFVEEIKHTQASILDTRKTIPGFRYLDKWAVRLGGGTNHRYRLDDQFLIKENHISVAGTPEEAIDLCVKLRDKKNLNTWIEIEVTDLNMFERVLRQGKADIVMLDNMSLTDMEKAVSMANGKVKLEASGNVNIDTVAGIAETGVDYISSGALTHSTKALDISMVFAI